MTATHTQVGRLGSYGGFLNGPASATSGSLMLHEIAERPKMLAGRNVMNWSYGCVRTGQFTTTMAAP